MLITINKANNLEEVSLASIFDIDFSSRRIFVVTEEAEVRAYTF